MMRLLLIRHGRTPANDEHLYCGSTDLPLSESGRDALIRLRTAYKFPSLDGFNIYTSGMRRTEETLRILYGDVPHSALPGFREADFGAFEMYSYEQLRSDPLYQTWCEGDNESNIPPQGESGAQMRGRVLQALADLRRPGDDAAVFCHGGPIAAVMAFLFPEEGKNRYQWQPENGRGYLIELTDHGNQWKPVPEEDNEHA